MLDVRRLLPNPGALPGANRWKGEITARMNGRDFPHIVELPLPEGGWKHGLYSAEAIAARRQATADMRLLRRIIANL